MYKSKSTFWDLHHLKSVKKGYWILTILLVTVGLFALFVYHSHTKKNVLVSPKKNGSYLAMGDSVAAGIGLPTYSDSSACDRTQESYPNIVAYKLHYTIDSRACSGATTSQGIIGPQEVNKLQVAPQVAALPSGQKPKLITITIGANDTDWTAFLQKCYTSTCGSTTDTLQITNAIRQLSDNLDKALTTIATNYPDHTPTVMLTGYYTLFTTKPVAGCSELQGIDALEQQWIAQLQTTINTTIQSAAKKYPFVTFVPIDFSGHELCSTAPWIQGLGSKAPYHPTEAGQTAIAKAIITTLKKDTIIQ